MTTLARSTVERVAPHPITAVVVDDEPLAREELVRLLTAYPDVRIVGQAESLADADRVIRAVAPDVVFLDIQLGPHTGFDLLAQLDATPEVVFVTAYEEHALRAFEVNALSYLLKPVQRQRLADVVTRLRSRTAPADVRPAPLDLDDHLFVERQRAWVFVKVRDVRAIAAEGNYSRLTMVDGTSALVRRPLAEWLERLPARRFVQVHRSTIVNLDLVERVEASSPSVQLVFLRGERTPIAMSRRFAAKLREHLA